MWNQTCSIWKTLLRFGHFCWNRKTSMRPEVINTDYWSLAVVDLYLLLQQTLLLWWLCHSWVMSHDVQSCFPTATATIRKREVWWVSLCQFWCSNCSCCYSWASSRTRQAYQGVGLLVEHFTNDHFAKKWLQLSGGLRNNFLTKLINCGETHFETLTQRFSAWGLMQPLLRGHSDKLMVGRLAHCLLLETFWLVANGNIKLENVRYFKDLPQQPNLLYHPVMCAFFTTSFRDVAHAKMNSCSLWLVTVDCLRLIGQDVPC